MIALRVVKLLSLYRHAIIIFVSVWTNKVLLYWFGLRIVGIVAASESVRREKFSFPGFEHPLYIRYLASHQMQVEFPSIRADLRTAVSCFAAASIFYVRSGHLRRKTVLVGWREARVGS